MCKILNYLFTAPFPFFFSSFSRHLLTFFFFFPRTSTACPFLQNARWFPPPPRLYEFQSFSQFFFNFLPIIQGLAFDMKDRKKTSIYQISNNIFQQTSTGKRITFVLFFFPKSSRLLPTYRSTSFPSGSLPRSQIRSFRCISQSTLSNLEPFSVAKSAFINWLSRQR